MSVFRVIVKRGASLCFSNNQIFKLNFNVPLAKRKHSYKTFSPLSSQVRRDYSNQNVQNTDEKEVIYTGFLKNNILRIKVFSLTTSFIGLSVQPIVYLNAVANGTASNLTMPVFGLIGVFAIATPLLLHYVTKRYVLSVEYFPKEDKYIATVYNLFAMKKKIEFTPKDVTIPTVLGMFTSCTIKGKPVFLDAKSFTEQSHFVRIMGYDKPLDLLVNNESDDTKKK